ncbi:helix-turn-helix domain-containing protein [Enterococcus sp. HY326]|uniref:helix-turn-helix domain-containing protein n=1 Tax=Enterococcus sp. HY326 TaxID=2971265 RepID=UPI00223F0E05|nr:helix-turn-helix domain-containing protein [Enterococcus sp. HY326]
MKAVLNTTMNRRISLLNLLFTSFKRVSLDSLSRQLNTTNKTIISDLDFFQENWPEVLKIDLNTKTGLRVMENGNQTVQTIYSDILKNSLEFQLLEGVFFKPNKNSKYWENHLFVSNSSLYRMGVRLSRKLRDFGIILEKNPFNLKGTNEEQLRIFFRNYFIEAYGFREWPFPFDQRTISGILKTLNHELKLNLNNVELYESSFTACVALIRIQQGNFIESKKSLKKIGFLQTNQILDEYLLQLQNKFEAVSTENLPLVKKDFLLTLFWKEVSWDNPAEEERLQLAAADFIEQIVKKANLTIDDLSRYRIKNLFISTYLKHKIYPYPRYIFYQRNNFSRPTVEMNYHDFSELIEQLILAIGKKYHILDICNYYDDILCKILIFWEGLPEMLQHNRQAIKVGICSNLGPAHIQALTDYFWQIFNSKIIIVPLNNDFHTLTKDNLPECDLFVANYLLQNVPKDRLIVMRDIPTVQNISTLRMEVEKRRHASKKSKKNWYKVLPSA